jgi:myosin heavy subunit
MFTDEELYEVLRILAIVLHLGNIQYTGKYSIFNERRGRKRK